MIATSPPGTWTAPASPSWPTPLRRPVAPTRTFWATCVSLAKPTSGGVGPSTSCWANRDWGGRVTRGQVLRQAPGGLGAVSFPSTSCRAGWRVQQLAHCRPVEDSLAAIRPAPDKQVAVRPDGLGVCHRDAVAAVELDQVRAKRTPPVQGAQGP